MGRYIKNTEIKTGSYSVRLPVGSNSVGPDYPVDGLIRFNKNSQLTEYYAENRWQQIQSAGAKSRKLSKDTFFGDGQTRYFSPMKYLYAPGEEIYLLVFVGNVFQNPGVAFKVDNDIIEFTSPPPNGQPIVILHGVAA